MSRFQKAYDFSTQPSWLAQVLGNVSGKPVRRLLIKGTVSMRPFIIWAKRTSRGDGKSSLCHRRQLLLARMNRSRSDIVRRPIWRDLMLLTIGQPRRIFVLVTGYDY